MREKPDYLTFNDDFSITVQLSRPYEAGGVKKDKLTLREPTAGEQRKFIPPEKASEGQLADMLTKELATLADGWTPQELMSMGLKDYNRVQRAFTFFTD